MMRLEMASPKPAGRVFHQGTNNEIMRKEVQEALEKAIAEFEKRQQAEQERLRERERFETDWLRMRTAVVLPALEEIVVLLRKAGWQCEVRTGDKDQGVHFTIYRPAKAGVSVGEKPFMIYQPEKQETHMRATIVEGENTAAVVDNKDRTMAAVQNEPALRLQFLKATCEHEFPARYVHQLTSSVLELNISILSRKRQQVRNIRAPLERRIGRRSRIRVE
jgi:hypothetical protein